MHSSPLQSLQQTVLLTALTLTASASGRACLTASSAEPAEYSCPTMLPAAVWAVLRKAIADCVGWEKNRVLAASAPGFVFSTCKGRWRLLRRLQHSLCSTRPVAACKSNGDFVSLGWDKHAVIYTSQEWR